MRELIISELTQAVQDLARGFAHYLPRLIVMLILAFVGFLIWLFAFSGIMFGHNGSSTTNNNVRIQQSVQQPANPGTNSGNTSGGGSPMPS